MRPEGCTNSPWVIVIFVPRSPSISKAAEARKVDAEIEHPNPCRRTNEPRRAPVSRVARTAASPAPSAAVKGRDLDGLRPRRIVESRDGPSRGISRRAS